MLAALFVALFFAQSTPRGVAVAGVVQDQTGAVLPNASVALLRTGSTTAAQSTTTDQSGAFHFDRVAPGEYEIRTEFPGFTLNTTHVRIGARAPSALTVIMTIEGVTQEVSVAGGGAET